MGNCGKIWEEDEAVHQLFMDCKNMGKCGKIWEENETVHQLLLDYKKTHDSLTREALYNILIQFGITTNLVRLIQIRLNETYTSVRVGTHVSDMFPVKNGLKQGDALSPLLFNFVLDHTIRRVQVNQFSLRESLLSRLKQSPLSPNLCTGRPPTGVTIPDAV